MEESLYILSEFSYGDVGIVPLYSLAGSFPFLHCIWETSDFFQYVASLYWCRFSESLEFCCCDGLFIARRLPEHSFHLQAYRVLDSVYPGLILRALSLLALSSNRRHHKTILIMTGLGVYIGDRFCGGRCYPPYLGWLSGLIS